MNRLTHGATTLALIAGVLLSSAAGFADPYVFGSDPSSDATGGSNYEIYGIGYQFTGTTLNVIVRTNFPQAGLYGGDTYNSNWHILPGDLYINVGGNHNASNGNVFGLGVTSHSGDVSSDYHENGYPWSAVQTGHLYSNATFSTGTYEGYPNASLNSGSPYDGGNDPFGGANNYPALIANYGSDLGYQSAVTYTAVTGQAWQYEIGASINLASLGATAGQNVDLWWAMSCGNDAAEVQTTVPPVPEPTTLAFLGFGALALLRRRRK